MFYNILDGKRIKILTLLKYFKEDFYLAGGTALALQIGHRDSKDFDFFTNKEFDTKKLFEKIENVFKSYTISKFQEEKDTLSISIDDEIKISFFSYPYKLVDDLIEEENLKLASQIDIGCMKLSAITGRASIKDYIDLYYILHNLKLGELIEKCLKKFPNIDKNLILKSIVYFEDMTNEQIIFKNNNNVKFEEVKNFLKKEIRSLITY